MAALIDLAGKRFGKLLVVRKGPQRNSLLTWHCRCDCGASKLILGQTLRRAETASCGCLQRELARSRLRQRTMTHGETTNRKPSPEYYTYTAMLSRCSNKNATGYANYGGRGIKVCQRWRESFANFLADMGRRPTPQHSIDRYPDNDGDYEPSNCRWATPQQQRLNQRKKTNAR